MTRAAASLRSTSTPTPMAGQVLDSSLRLCCFQGARRLEPVYDLPQLSCCDNPSQNLIPTLTRHGASFAVRRAIQGQKSNPDTAPDVESDRRTARITQASPWREQSCGRLSLRASVASRRSASMSSRSTHRDGVPFPRPLASPDRRSHPSDRSCEPPDWCQIRPMRSCIRSVIASAIAFRALSWSRRTPRPLLCCPPSLSNSIPAASAMAMHSVRATLG